MFIKSNITTISGHGHIINNDACLLTASVHLGTYATSPWLNPMIVPENCLYCQHRDLYTKKNLLFCDRCLSREFPSTRINAQI